MRPAIELPAIKALPDRPLLDSSSLKHPKCFSEGSVTVVSPDLRQIGNARCEIFAPGLHSKSFAMFAIFSLNHSPPCHSTKWLFDRLRHRLPDADGRARIGPIKNTTRR